jgi:hypothetical protein
MTAALCRGFERRSMITAQQAGRRLRLKGARRRRASLRDGFAVLDPRRSPPGKGLP